MRLKSPSVPHSCNPLGRNSGGVGQRPGVGSPSAEQEKTPLRRGFGYVLALFALNRSISSSVRIRSMAEYIAAI